MALVFFAGQRLYATLGPSKAVAAADGSLVLLSHGKLHRFGKDGIRSEVIDLAQLGVPVRPSDFALHRDGRLVISDPDASVLHRCKLPGGPCETLDIGLSALPGQAALPLNAAKLYIDDDAQRYYVSDNFGHRVVIADFAGKALAHSGRGTFSHPNQLATRAPGELSVVDTDHRRVATFEVTGDRWGRLVDSLDTDAGGVARPGRVWPFDSVRAPNGDTWVLIARGHMEDADLVVFDPRAKAVRRIDLGDDSDPFDIEAWRGRIWVSDATNYRFESVSFDGRRGAIEDRAFIDELASERQVPKRWRMARAAGQVGAFLTPLIALIVLGWRARRR